MSEQAPEAPARGKKENVFTRKIGPLPMWVWVVIIGGVILAWSFYKSKTTAASSADTTGSTTDASQVPQFVNQTYVQPSPPGPVGPTGSTGPPGPTGPPAPEGTRPPTPLPPIIRTPGPKPRTEQFRTQRLRYKGNLEQIAKRNHTDVEDLLEANPGLKRYPRGHVYPVGTTIKIPPAAA